jgi:hypothetical protein
VDTTDPRGAAAQQVRDLLAFIEADPRLHVCSPLDLLGSVPPELLPAASALIEVQFLHGSGDPSAPEPVGILNAMGADAVEWSPDDELLPDPCRARGVDIARWFGVPVAPRRATVRHPTDILRAPPVYSTTRRA